MPVHWFIDSRMQVVEVTAESRVTRADSGYAKIFDATRAEGAMTKEDSPQRSKTFAFMKRQKSSVVFGTNEDKAGQFVVNNRR